MAHIVDQLIEERATRLRQRPALWRSIRALVYPLLGYRRAIAMADHIRDLDGLAVFDYLSETLAMQVEGAGAEHIPASGPALITANHPAGIADGIAVYDLLKEVRRDLTFFANRDALRVAPGLADVVVPVEWRVEHRSHQRNRETVRHMLEAFRRQRLVVIFPSGRLAAPTLRGLVEREWLPTALNLAQKRRCPVLPLHVQGHNSALYYGFYYLHEELRDMTLFRELLNKRGQRYRLILGEPFDPVGDVRQLTAALHQHVVERMPRGHTRFDPAAAGVAGASR